jgi:hypothetical protein
VRRQVPLLVAALAVVWFSMEARGLAQVYPPNQSQQLTAVCYDEFNQIVPYCDVVLATGYYQFSNGHHHDDPSHPKSTVQPTSGNTGCCGLPITIQTTLVGQEESVTACPYPTGNCGVMNYAVGWSDLSFVQPNSFWTLRGGNTTNHGDNNFNHWATNTLKNGIVQTASDFLFEHPEVGQIALNDMALPIGGRFDIDNNWVPPHADHDRGLAVDVNFVPSNLANEFVEWCRLDGARFTLIGTNEIHCRW